jgi:TPR repeat protein
MCAEEGHAFGSFALGELLEKQGRQSEAWTIFAQLSDQNFLPAVKRIAVAYEYGNDQIKQNSELAIRCWKKACEQQDEDSMYFVALKELNNDYPKLYFGRVTPKSITRGDVEGISNALQSDLDQHFDG